MARFLFVTWDGAGNLVPTLGLVRRLARKGHDVRVLGHRSIAERCGVDGWRFRECARTPPFDSAAPPAAGHDMSVLVRQLWAGEAPGRDMLDELAREPADALVIDCMLLGALSAAETQRMPAAGLFHGAYAIFRRGPLVAQMSQALPGLNEARARFGLPPVGSISDVHDRCALNLVATPKEFEPDAPAAANVRFVGPILDGPALMRSVDDVAAPDGGAPLVVVSFSTSHQDQVSVLARCIQALGSLDVRAIVTTGPAVDPSLFPIAPPNVQIVRFAPHDRLLPHASLVVTHAGLGTVMSSLAHGVPVLALPLGRDQHFNAARLEAIGAGRALTAGAGAPDIAAAVRTLVNDAGVREGAARMARAISAYGNGAQAVPYLERLLQPGAPAAGRAVRAETAVRPLSCRG
jgi:MGT family glycosyltransferase